MFYMIAGDTREDSKTDSRTMVVAYKNVLISWEALTGIMEAMFKKNKLVPEV